MKKTLLSLSILSMLSANAGENHHHHDDKISHIGAHVHGVAELNIVADGHHLELMLKSPAMNIVGFEHKPSNEKDLNQAHDALHTIKDAHEGIIIKGGNCKVDTSSTDWQYKQIIVNHFHPEKAETHNHDEHQHDEHKHVEHRHDKHDEHKHEHEHAHAEGANHSDIAPTYIFHCQSTTAIQSITVNLFDAFPAIEKLNTQWIANDQQGAQTLTAKTRKITLPHN